MANNPNRKGAVGTFEILKSNAVGDSYVDPGQYYLRSSTYTTKGEVRPDTGKSNGRVFKPSGGPKKVRHSEFKHHHNGPPPPKDTEPRKNFLTRSTYELFQKNMPYTEDEFH